MPGNTCTSQAYQAPDRCYCSYASTLRVADATDKNDYKKKADITVADATDKGDYKKKADITVADATDKNEYTVDGAQ